MLLTWSWPAGYDDITVHRLPTVYVWLIYYWLLYAVEGGWSVCLAYYSPQLGLLQLWAPRQAGGEKPGQRHLPGPSEGLLWLFHAPGRYEQHPVPTDEI